MATIGFVVPPLPSLLETAVESDSILFAAAWLPHRGLTFGCPAGADL